MFFNIQNALSVKKTHTLYQKAFQVTRNTAPATLTGQNNEVNTRKNASKKKSPYSAVIREVNVPI